MQSSIQETTFSKAELLNTPSYINIYKMKKRIKNQILHSPTLETVLMVEKTIYKHSGELGKYQLWKKLPRKVMYQTFLLILDYLEETNKILIDKRDGKIVWIWDPEGVRKLLKQGLVELK